MEQENKNKHIVKNKTPKKPVEKQNTPAAPEFKTVPLSDLNLKVTNATNTELINEHGNTVVCLLMQEDGKVLTSFAEQGNYPCKINKFTKG